MLSVVELGFTGRDMIDVDGLGFKVMVMVDALEFRWVIIVGVVGLGFRSVVVVGIAGLGFSGIVVVDIVGCSGVLLVVAFGLWFRGVDMEDRVAPRDKPTLGVRAKGVAAVAAVGFGLSGVFNDGVLVSVFMVTVVMVSDATSGPVERGGGETDTVFVM